MHRLDDDELRKQVSDFRNIVGLWVNQKTVGTAARLYVDAAALYEPLIEKLGSAIRRASG